MSKETMVGSTCKCGNRITFVMQHYPHCPERENWKPITKVREEKSGGKTRKSRRERNQASEV